MAPVGDLSVVVALERCQIQGPEEPIRGTISLKFCANTSPSSKGQDTLFGPLELSIVLRGRMKLQVAENRTSHAYIWFYDNHDLFLHNFQLWKGPFRAVPDELKQVPFSVKFPRVITRYPSNPVPPTFNTRFQADAVRQAGKHQGVASIEYTLAVEAAMPGIDVSIINDIPAKPIQYEQPGRSPDAMPTQDISQELRVQTYALMPAKERPSGLVDRTKAAFKNVPKPIYVFNATCVGVPTTVVVGQPVQFDFRVQTDSKKTTAKEVPQVTFGDCNIKLVARTELYATNQKGIDSPRLDSFANVGFLVGKEKDSGPFSKQHDFTKTLRFGPLPLDIPSSFAVLKLSRSYRMRLELRFIVAEQLVLMKKDVTVQVVPGVLPSTVQDRDVVAGPSRSNGHEFLPAYEEVAGYA